MGRKKKKKQCVTIVLHGLRYAKLFYNIDKRTIQKYMVLNIQEN